MFCQPASIFPFTEKGVATFFPETDTLGNVSGGMHFHIIETAMADYCFPLGFIDGRVDKLRYSANLAGHIFDQIGEMHDVNIW